jgi:hypothetical protein
MVYMVPRGVGPLAVAASALFALLPAGTGAAPVDRLVAERMTGNKSGVATQHRIDGLGNETDQMIAEYRTVIQQTKSLRTYNRQIEELIASQEAEMVSLHSQIDRVELVGRQVTPLMLEMIEALDAFVELDVPFLLDERLQRVATLQELMLRADVTDAERYRRIVEAYQIENEYGRTIEAYQGELAVEGKRRTVDFLRVGRVILLYQTFDGAETGAWDQKQQVWVAANGYQSGVRDGLRIARKQAAPDLLRLPVPAAETIQ